MSFFDSFDKFVVRLQFGSGARIEFYEAMTLLMENGVLLNDALKEMYRVASDEGRKPKNPQAIVFYDCMMGVAEGRPLSKVLAAWVSPEECSLIAAGEKSGRLVDDKDGPGAFSQAIKVITAKRQIMAAIAMAVLGRLPGFGRGADLKTRCTAPAIRTSYPHEDLVTAAALASVLILVAAAALRFRRGVLPLAAGQVAVSLGLLWLDFPERLFRVPHVSGPFVCSYLRSTYVTVDIFRASLQVVVVAGPVLLLLVAIMRLRQPRPDPPLPPASVRRRFWDLLR